MSNFGKYLRWNYPDIVGQRPQLLEVAGRMEAFLRNGKTGDVLNISMPTRFGKSLLATAFSSWLLLTEPDKRIMRASYSAELAETFGLQVRDLYCKFFERAGQEVPAIDGTRGRWSIDGQVQPNHIAVGIGGSITGFGCDMAIIDDTAKNMLEATSAAYSRQLQVFKDSVLLGRLEGPRKIINVGTRWTVNDWFSMWPDAESYVLPAMTVDGQSCCEAWKTTAELELERERVSEEVWLAQYQQRPTATGKVRMFEGWRPKVEEVPEGGRRYIVVDPATDYGQDFFVAGVYVHKDGLLWLDEMYARQAAPPEEVAGWIKRREEASVCWCEVNGVGVSVIGKLRAAGVRNVAGFATKRDKYSRAYMQMESIKNYLRMSPRMAASDAWVELCRELDSFPVEDGSTHDDLLDNVVMAFEKLLV